MMGYRTRLATIVALIGELDQCLSLLRSQWQKAKDPDKTDLSERIDAFLDQRIVMMRSRDKLRKHLSK